MIGPAQGIAHSERRTLAIGIAAILMIVLLGRSVPAWRAALADRRASATQLTRELGDAERALARHGSLRDMLATRNARLQSVSATLVAGADDGAAGRALAAIVSGAAMGAEVRLTSTSVLENAATPPRAAMGEQGAAKRRTEEPRSLLRTVAVRIVGNGDIRGIATLLQTIERGPTRLRVRSMAVTQPDVAAGDERVEMLQLEMVVEGLALAHRDTPRAAVARETVRGGGR